MKEKVIELIKSRLEKYENRMAEQSKIYSDIVNKESFTESELKEKNQAHNLIQYNGSAWFELKSLLNEIEKLNE